MSNPDLLPRVYHCISIEPTIDSSYQPEQASYRATGHNLNCLRCYSVNLIQTHYPSCLEIPEGPTQIIIISLTVCRRPCLKFIIHQIAYLFPIPWNNLKTVNRLIRKNVKRALSSLLSAPPTGYLTIFTDNFFINTYLKLTGTSCSNSDSTFLVI